MSKITYGVGRTYIMQIEAAGRLGFDEHSNLTVYVNATRLHLGGLHVRHAEVVVLP
jgi:hypothetical protein